MKKTITNPILGKIIILLVLLCFIFYFFLVSSFKTTLNCENNICNLKTSYLIGETINKDMVLAGDDFYCREKRKLEYSKVEEPKSRNVYILMLQDEKIFKYAYKDSCTRELSDLKTSLKQNNSYSNTYEHFFINVLYKLLGIFLIFLSFLILISKISPVHIEIKTKYQNRKLP